MWFLGRYDDPEWAFSGFENGTVSVYKELGL